jgi:hypothetical protein
MTLGQCVRARHCEKPLQIVNNRPVPTIAYSTYSCHRTPFSVASNALNSPITCPEF